MEISLEVGNSYSIFSLFAFANDVNVFAFASAVKSV